MNLGEFAQGLQHIGLPTNDMKKTVAFYESLGFEAVYRTVNEEAAEEVVFLRLGNLTLEAYENGKAALCSGAIDHIAIDIRDVESAFALAKEQGFTIVSEGIEFLPFWENGVKFFIILGPNAERIEFNEILKKVSSEDGAAVDCPCRKKKCERFGKCDECREYHKTRRHPPYCERPEKK